MTYTRDMTTMWAVDLQIANRTFSEPISTGIGCGNSARPDLWGSGEATNRSTRNVPKTQLEKNKITMIGADISSWQFDLF